MKRITTILLPLMLSGSFVYVAYAGFGLGLSGVTKERVKKLDKKVEKKKKADEAAVPTVQFTLANSNGSESTTPANLELTLSVASGQNVTVNYAVTGGTAQGAGVDYTLAAGTATIPAGSLTTNISAVIINDLIAEPDETIIVTISSPVNATLGANTVHTYTINDNDGDFVVDNIESFQIALNMAATNGRNDTIIVSSGTYNVTATLTYSSIENYSLTIVGAGAGLTILSGGNARQILNMNTSGGNANISVKNMTFRNGKSTNNGAGFYAWTEGESANIIIENCEFNDNTTTAMGGGVSVLSNGTISISNCFFRRNSANRNAGGLNADAPIILLTNSVFEDNEVPGSLIGPEYDGGGALLYADDANGQIIVTGNTFNRNRASDGGGGLMTYSVASGVSTIINNNSFTDNTAQLDGGGCFTRNNESGGIITYKNNYLSGNSAMINGGGTMIFFNDGTLDYSNNTYTNNTANGVGDGGGGGAWIWQGTGSMNITSNTFTSNKAPSYNGGGAVIITDTATVKCSRNIFNGNTASGVGGGLSYATGSGTLNFYHNTFYGNHAPGGGGGGYFYFDGIGAQTTCYNNILWRDTPDGLDMSGATSATATYSDIEGGTGQPWFGTGCIDIDPLFVDPGAGNFNLTAGSPCIDTGDPASPLDPDSTRADMGFFYFPH